MPGLDDAHDLMPPELAATMPGLYATENEADPVGRVRYFTPDSMWSWLITEYSPDKRLAFGLVIGPETELGYVSLSELEASRGPLGLAVERDLHWEPKPLSQCRSE